VGFCVSAKLIGAVSILNFHNSTRRQKIGAPTKEPPVTAPKPSSFHQRLIHALGGWRRRVVDGRRARDAQRHLVSMSDHELRDLGIGRSELPALMDRYR
jgi:uncharacterized protein YjiS (DUF1127 family)